MAITVVTPDEWNLTPPASGHGRLLGMTLQEQGPYVRILEEEPNFYNSPHSHSESEVFVVLAGRLFFNGQWVGPGTVISVPANEDYWHSTGEDHCVVVVIRSKDRGKIRRIADVAAAE